MSRAPSNFRQQDVTRAMRAARTAGFELMRVEVDVRTGKITLVVREDEDVKTVEVNPFDTAPV